MALTLSVLPETFAVCQLKPDAENPPWGYGKDLYALVWTREELSIVCPESDVPVGVHCERGWRALKIRGPLDFSLVGILAQLAGILAEAGISIFAISTYDTDYILVKENQLDAAVVAIRQAGHQFVGE